jgi:hypothetical protein
MTVGLVGNSDGSGAVQVGGVNAINISTSQIVSFANPLQTLSLTGPTITNLNLAAGTTALAPLDFTAGSLLTTPVAGAVEFDGNAFYTTDDVTEGRGYIPSVHYFRLTSDITAFGPAIANFFGPTSGMALDAGIFYELEVYLYFTKTTANTVTFTMTFSNAPINNNAFYVGTPSGGVGTVGTPQTAALVKSTATTASLPVTGGLSNGLNHQYVVQSFFQANATTGGTLNLQITSASGTVTPLTGSYYKLTRLPSANTGIFV